jgi:outer membrane immunogenic protein
MKKISTLLFALATVTAISAPASAADMRMPVKAPPPVVAPVPMWTGFYIGLNAGGAFTDSDYTLNPEGCFLTGACGGSPAFNPLRTESGNHDGASFIGGGQIGYNWQAASWVFGIEADIQYNSLSETVVSTRALAAPLAGTISHSNSLKTEWFGTVRGRIGFLVQPNWLLYATGGLAYGNIKSASTVAFTGADTYAGGIDTTRAGWTVGGGTEWQFDRNWSLKLEYLYVDLGSVDYGVPCVSPGAFCAGFAPAPAYSASVDVTQHIGRAGINYKF